MARVLITGASGFIGSFIGPRLAEAGHQVRGMVRHRGDLGEGWSEIVRAEELTDVEAIRAAVRDVDAVVHLAARVHVLDETATSPLDAFRRANVEGTRILFEEARRAGVERFVFASSVKAIAEWSNVPIQEDTPPRPADPYGISKVEAEQWLRSAAPSGGPATAILRLPLLYGPRVKANMRRLFDTVARGIPLPFASVQNRRSFLFVGNLASAIDRLLSMEWRGAETFLLSDQQDLSTPELIRAIGVALGRPARLFPVPPRLFELAGKAGDIVARRVPVPLNSANVRRLIGSLAVEPRRMAQLCGWSPPHSVEQGLAVTARWYLGLNARPRFEQEHNRLGDDP